MDTIKARKVGGMAKQRLLSQINRGHDAIARLQVSGTKVTINTVYRQEMECAIREKDRQFLSDLHSFTPSRTRVTGGGYMLQNRDEGNAKIRRVGHWDELTDTEMQLVLEDVYRLVPCLHGITFTPEEISKIK